MFAHSFSDEVSLFLVFILRNRGESHIGMKTEEAVHHWS